VRLSSTFRQDRKGKIPMNDLISNNVMLSSAG